MAIYLPHTEPQLILKAVSALIFFLVVFFGILFIVEPTLRTATVVVFLALCWGTCRFGYVNTRYSTHCIIMQAIPLLITLGLCAILRRPQKLSATPDQFGTVLPHVLLRTQH
jgi:hypothetical protein